MSNVEIGRRRDFHLKMLGAVGQRGGEVSMLRIQQLFAGDVFQDFAGMPDAYHDYGQLRGDTIMFRWLAQEKSAGIQDRTRAMMRSPTVDRCPVSALGLHLSHQIDTKPRGCSSAHLGQLISEIVSGEMVERSIPGSSETVTEPVWYTTHLLYGSTIDVGLVPGVLYKEARKALEISGIGHKTAVQHLFRYSRMQRVDTAGERDAAKVPWSKAGTADKTYMAASLDITGTFIGCGWGPQFRMRHIMGRNAASWAVIEGEEWLRDPAMAHLVGIPAYIRARLFGRIEEAAQLFAEKDLAEQQARAMPAKQSKTRLAELAQQHAGHTTSAQNVTEVLLKLRTVYMQDLPFHLQSHAAHPVFVQHPLFADDTSGIFREWLRRFWCLRVLSLHEAGLRLLHELNEPVTMAQMGRMFQSHSQAPIGSPQSKQQAAAIAQAIMKIASPAKPEALPVGIPERTKRQQSSAVKLMLVRRPDRLQQVMDEYLVGRGGHPPLQRYMRDFRVIRGVATWASASDEGGFACNGAWHRRKHLVEGVMHVAERVSPFNSLHLLGKCRILIPCSRRQQIYYQMPLPQSHGR